MRRSGGGVAAVLTTVAISVGGCASSGGGLLPAGGTGSAASPSSTVSPVDFAATMRRGLSTVRSVHVTLGVDFAGRKSTGSGDVTLHAGKVEDLQLSTRGVHGSGSLRLVIADGKIYAKLPKQLNTTGKPYVLISTDSANAQTHRVATRIEAARRTVSLADAADLLAKAESVRRVGTTSIGGTRATCYAVRVDPADLPHARAHAMPLSVRAFVRDLDVDVCLDSADRPVRVDLSVSAGGQQAHARLSLSRYDQPVTISAPPADQVGTP